MQAVDAFFHRSSKRNKQNIDDDGLGGDETEEFIDGDEEIPLVSGKTEVYCRGFALSSIELSLVWHSEWENGAAG